jgi:hypothetical protein
MPITPDADRLLRELQNLGPLAPLHQSGPLGTLLKTAVAGPLGAISDARKSAKSAIRSEIGIDSLESSPSGSGAKTGVGSSNDILGSIKIKKIMGTEGSRGDLTVQELATLPDNVVGQIIQPESSELNFFQKLINGRLQARAGFKPFGEDSSEIGRNFKTQLRQASTTNLIKDAEELASSRNLLGETQGDLPASIVPFLQDNQLLARGPDIVEPRFGPPQAQHVGNTLEQAVSSVDPTLLQSLGVDEFFGQPSAPRPDLGLEPVVTPGGIDPNAPLSPQALRLGAARLKTDLATQRGQIPQGSSFEIERQKQINALRKSEADLANTASLIQERERSGGAVQERLKLLESKVDFEREQKKAARNVQLLNVTKFLFEESGLEGAELVEKLSDAMDILIPDSPKVTVKERSFINNILKKLKGEQDSDIFLGERKAEEVVIEPRQPRPLSEQELKAEEERQRRRF